MTIYRAQCGPDLITVIFRPKAKTNDEIIKIQNDSTYSAWVKKDDLFYLTPLQGYELPDSVWVESSCNCDSYVCTD